MLKDREKGEAELRAKKSLNCEKKKNYKFDIVAVSCSGISSEKYVSTLFFPIFLFKLVSAGFRAPSPGGSPLGKKGAKAEKKSENPSFRRIDPVERTGRMADHRICFHQTSAILILAPGRSAGWCADALHVSALHQSPSFAVDVTGGPLSAK